jgi:hypothetical protein
MSFENPDSPQFGAPAPVPAPEPPTVSSADAVPQFATAEYGHIPGAAKCSVCGKGLSDEYYQVNGHAICAVCARQITEGQKVDSHAGFMRAISLGAGAAILGMAVYATVEIVTHWRIGYLALGVGWLVAKAMMKGSNGIGGRRYQVAAVLLTYAAISMAAVPVGISFMIAKKHAAASQSAQSSGASSADDSSATNSNDAQPKPRMDIGKAIGGLLFIGLASPFLELQDPFHGLIGLFILFIGLRIAWQLTRAKVLAVAGPYPLTPA